jgi:hypothetical protein
MLFGCTFGSKHGPRTFRRKPKVFRLQRNIARKVGSSSASKREKKRFLSAASHASVVRLPPFHCFEDVGNRDLKLRHGGERERETRRVRTLLVCLASVLVLLKPGFSSFSRVRLLMQFVDWVRARAGVNVNEKREGSELYWLSVSHQF